MKKVNIAIDGFSACGKSTTAKAMARELGYLYVDSGAMYRAVTLYFLDHNITLTNPREVQKALDNIKITFHVNPKTGETETFLNVLRVEEEIRTMRVTEHVSQVSALSPVRKAMVSQQQKFGKKKGVVMDGRDIGTVVFPDAALKIFMIADMNIRAERRQKELFEKNQLVDFEEVKANLARRDAIDSTREDSPLKQADDALIIDTTYLTLDEQIEEGLNLATSRILEQN
ncbi:MAG: (d)CMP kinase [Bacteroidetes bacterium]|nr:(d)CMP kinase [Bacteroidota bacterium]